MALPIEALSTQASLPARRIGHGRTHSAATEPQRPDLSARGDESRASRQGIAPQPLSSQVTPPSIRVEYQQNRPILKLHDRSGVLVYQVPSKGALQLITQEEARSWSLSERA